MYHLSAKKDSFHRQLGNNTALETPERRYGMVALNFIVGLSTTKSGYDIVLTFVHQVSILVHFVPRYSLHTETKIVKTFFRKVLSCLGLPDALISDRDPRCFSIFWKKLFKMCGIQLKMSSSRVPPTDSSSEVINRMLGNDIRCNCEYNQGNWDLLLHAAE